MSDIVERLRFDAARCEMQFSKGVAGNIEEAADEIERLTAELARIRGLPRLAALDAEIQRLRADHAESDAFVANAIVKRDAEIERLTAWLQEIAREQDATDADYFRAIARAALAGQPLAGKEPKP